ncbi:c-type cytochrome [Hydrogenophaga sp. T2]|uniref:c-type cytochrome n=1 Tax=Hydrogenophaga sp. T2 TaxID=3132823 RepID=UPI003CED9D48
MKRIIALPLAGAALLAAATAAWLLWPTAPVAVAPAAPAASALAVPAPAALVQRGAYLARAGNCAACHTERGGADYAGGKGLATPFGTVYASNLTPDADTGIGRWSADDFWRAMHHGQSRDGRLLYPAFPYTEYTRVRREDADALFAYLQSLPPVAQANRPHALGWPYRTQAALKVWRALFFTPGTFEADASRSAEWNRGAYLVQGLGHCQACHAPRNAFGATATSLDLSGGLIPLQKWYAPSLAAADEAGLQRWSEDEAVQLLRDGRSAHGAMLGPMAEVVAGSTRHLDESDLRAMANFLRALPEQPVRRERGEPATAQVLERGAGLYEQHCAQCHGAQGEGHEGLYLPLAGNRSVGLQDPTNLLRLIVSGGFTPSTAGNPRPFGMPPFGQDLSDADIAAVASFVRSRWGNEAGRVLPLDVQKVR